MIRKDKNYQYANGEDAIILCYDRPFSPKQEIVSMRHNGVILFHDKETGVCLSNPKEYTLIEAIVYEYHFAITTSGDTARLDWLTMKESVELGNNHNVYQLPDVKRIRQ